MKHKKKIMNWLQYFFTTLFLLFSIVFSVLYFNNLSLSFNTTESLPQSVFVVEENLPFTKGDLIQFEYKDDGKHFFADKTKMIKKVVGVSGDKVTFIDREFFINGKSFGIAKTHAKNGTELTPNISKTLDDNEYFVWTPHVDSFDSRYIHQGYISQSQIKGTVIWSW
ncbi:hypothetical protein JCM30760_26160 [Thiomicrorhabdus hydrogeniphila]